MELNVIYNQDCMYTMPHELDLNSIDCILTSPPYNTSRTNCDFHNDTKNGRYTNRYVDFNDMKSDDEYAEWTIELFKLFHYFLKENGVILYNLNYGKNTHESYYKLIADIIDKTPFTIADTICWQKHTAVPNSASPNKLTRIWEHIFVFVRKDEYDTFYTNKKIVSFSKNTGQKNYENIRNLIRAENNDGSNKIHKATFSTSLCKQLLKIYCPANGIVYDPFIGTGTTAKACIELGLNYIGSEIYKPYYDFAVENIKTVKYNDGKNNKIDDKEHISNDMLKLHKDIMKLIISFCDKHNITNADYLSMYCSDMKDSILNKKWHPTTDSYIALYKTFDDVINGNALFENI